MRSAGCGESPPSPCAEDYEGVRDQVLDLERVDTYAGERLGGRGRVQATDGS